MFPLTGRNEASSRDVLGRTSAEAGSLIIHPSEFRFPIPTARYGGLNRIQLRTDHRSGSGD
jgi:hypothetical protein